MQIHFIINYSCNPYFILEVHKGEIHGTYSFHLTHAFQQESRDLFIPLQTLSTECHEIAER